MIKTTQFLAATAAMALGTLLTAFPAAVGAVAPVPGSAPSTIDMPPCEAEPPIDKPSPSVPTAPTNLRILGGSGGDAELQEDLPSGPAAWPEMDSASTFAPAAFVGPHDYYVALASRPDCLKAYSLRSQAQIEQYRRGLDKPSQVTYDFAKDSDPRKQDAAKLVITGNSLQSQVWLPLRVDAGSTVLITWDAWFGQEFNYNNTLITNYKNFQFGSPAEMIWTEVRTNFSGAKDAIGALDGRYYGSLVDNARGPNVTDTQPLSPQLAPFTIQAETWVRYWALFETNPDGWDLYSLWVADEKTGPVQIYDRLQLKLRDGKLGVFRLEYNTSTSGVPEGRGPLVAYFRNMVMLANPNVSTLLQRPIR